MEDLKASKAKCRSLTLKGVQCKNASLKGYPYCFKHSLTKRNQVPRYIRVLQALGFSSLLALVVALSMEILPEWWFGRNNASKDDVNSLGVSLTNHLPGKRELSQIDGRLDNLPSRSEVAQIVSSEVKRILSEKARTIDSNRWSEFRQKYPDGYIVFSVSETFVSEELTRWDSNKMKFEWQSAEVSSMNSNVVSFSLLGVKFSGPALLEVGRISFDLERVKGASAGGWAYTMGTDRILNLKTNLTMFVEVAENNPMGVSMVAGFKTVVQSFPQKSSISSKKLP